MDTNLTVSASRRLLRNGKPTCLTSTSATTVAACLILRGVLPKESPTRHEDRLPYCSLSCRLCADGLELLLDGKPIAEAPLMPPKPGLPAPSPPANGTGIMNCSASCLPYSPLRIALMQTMHFSAGSTSSVPSRPAIPVFPRSGELNITPALGWLHDRDWLGGPPQQASRIHLHQPD